MHNIKYMIDLAVIGYIRQETYLPFYLLTVTNNYEQTEESKSLFGRGYGQSC